jgi:ankyrin repeat protein
MGHAPVVRELACRGAKLDSPDRDGETALFIAAQVGPLNILRILVHREFL